MQTEAPVTQRYLNHRHLNLRHPSLAQIADPNFGVRFDVTHGAILPLRAINAMPPNLQHHARRRIMIIPKREVIKTVTLPGKRPLQIIAKEEPKASAIHNTYFEVNYSGPGSLDQSQRNFIHMLYLHQNYKITKNLRLEIESIPSEQRHLKDRVLTAFFQNFVNDATPIQYGMALIAAVNSTLQNNAASEHIISSGNNMLEEFKILQEQESYISSIYYRLVGKSSTSSENLDIDYKQVNDFFDTSRYAMNRIHRYFQRVEQVTGKRYDYLRNRRETDLELTTFMSTMEYRDELAKARIPEEDTLTLIPLLGAHDLKGSLEAQGFKGQTMFIVPEVKVFDENHERKNESIPITSQQITAIKEFMKKSPNKKLLIYEDTIIRGKHLIDIVKQLQKEGISLYAIRAVNDGAKDIITNNMCRLVDKAAKEVWIHRTELDNFNLEGGIGTYDVSDRIELLGKDRRRTSRPKAIHEDWKIKSGKIPPSVLSAFIVAYFKNQEKVQHDHEEYDEVKRLLAL